MSLPIFLGWVPNTIELALILGVALLLFGTRIPTVMRSLGKGVNEFKAGMRDGEQSNDNNSSASNTTPTEKKNNS